MNRRRLDTRRAQDALRPHSPGVLLGDDSGDRKAGSHTAHGGRQSLGSSGKIDNGIVAVTTVGADERVYSPLPYAPYTPASRLPKGRADRALRTKPPRAAALSDEARGVGVPYRASVADCFYGDPRGFVEALERASLPYVLALKPNKGTWASAEDAHPPPEAAQDLRWENPEAPGDWPPVRRRFRDGHEQTWWAAELTLGGRGPDQRPRLVVATTAPAPLPALRTWYLLTNLPRPGSPQAAPVPGAPAALEELVRWYGLRLWVEQSDKPVQGQLGGADFQVRRDTAIQRHGQLGCCAFTFCWWAWFHVPPAERDRFGALVQADPAGPPAPPPAALDAAGRGENRGRHGRRRAAAPRLLAGHAAAGAGLADPLGAALALVAGVVHAPAAPRTPRIAGRGRAGPTLVSLSPLLTNLR